MCKYISHRIMFHLIYISKCLCNYLPRQFWQWVRRRPLLLLWHVLYRYVIWMEVHTQPLFLLRIWLYMSSVLSALGMWRIFQKRLLPGMNSCKRFMCNELFMHCVVCFVYQRCTDADISASAFTDVLLRLQ